MKTLSTTPVSTISDTGRTGRTGRSGRRPVGEGTLRERRPGVWEVRVVVGPPGRRGRRAQRSVSVHGTRLDAERVRADLTARPVGPAPPDLITLGEVLRCWLDAEHPWRPSTWVGTRSVVRALLVDPIAEHRVTALTAPLIRAVMTRWQREDVSLAVAGGRFRVTRAALSWAYDERLVDVHPLRFTRGPGRCTPRRPISDSEVRLLLRTAATRLLEAVANDTGDGAGRLRVHRSELDLLALRLAADSGARRGELAALRLDNLEGRVLRIERADSAGQLLAPKSGRARSLTLGAGTAALWHDLETRWRSQRMATHGEPLGPWLFSSDLAHRHRLGSAVLGHRFAAIRDEAGVPEASLHRLRHNVATFLVARGEVLQARNRLGHADAATTLREYSYAAPLTDQHVADAIDRLLLDADTDAPDPRAGSFTGDRRARMPQSRA